MGNIEGTHRWDDDLECRHQRQLPSSRQDFHWLVVGFQHLFDADYLNKEFRSEEGQASHPSSGGHGAGIVSTKNRSFEEHCREEEMDMADATLFLLPDGQSGLKLGQDTSRRLTQELVSRCRVNDRFFRVLAQRSHMLTCVHEAWLRSYHEKEQALVHQSAKLRHELGLIGTKPLGSCISGQSEAQVGLALDLLFNMIDVVDEPGGDAIQRGVFIQQIEPFLKELPPLSLADEGTIRLSVGESTVSRPCVLDKLRDFLYLASLPGEECCLGHETHSVTAISAEDTHEQLRESATLALAGLISAAGRAKDFLLLIKLLLRVGHPRPISGREGGDEVPQYVVSPVQQGTVPSRVEAPFDQPSSRKVRHGLGVRRPLNVACLGGREVEDVEGTGGDRSSSSGGNSNLPEDMIMAMNLRHMHGNKDSDCSSSSLKEKPSRPVFTSGHKIHAHQAVSVERPQPPRALPSSMLPFLRKLGTTSLHGSLSQSRAEDPAGQQREVWTCGQNSYGELAHGDTTSRKTHMLVDYCMSRDVIGVAAGNEHTVILTRSGDVYTAGYNDNGQCGLGGTQRVGQLTLVEKLVGKGTTQVHASNGCEHTLVVLGDGRLVSFGYNYRGQLGHGTTTSEPIPKVVRGLEGKRVTLVSCSYYHSIVACDSGEVYSFGRNDYGQLGHGDTVDKKVPHLIESLRGHNSISLACGQYHSMVATREGKLFCCGKNDYGQLGLETSEGQKHMLPLAMDGPAAVVEVRCGYYHTIALTDSGRVYGFGRNDYGQLGLGHIAQRVHGPQAIEAVEGKSIVRIAAGCYHSVLVGKNGMLYVCGRNNHGQLGTGDTNERHLPHPIDLFLGKRVAQVAAGFYHTIVLTGGLEADGSSDCNSADSVAFSADTFLSLPSFTLPTGMQEECSLGNAASAAGGTSDELPQAMDGESADLLGQTTSPEEESVDVSVNTIDDSAHLKSMLGAADNHSESSNMQPSNVGSWAPVTKAGGRDSNSGRSTGVGAEKPNGEKMLCNVDGAVPQEKAAIFLLAQLDRLASTFRPRSSFPPALASKAALVLSHKESGTQQSFCVDSSAETLELLLCLLAHFHDNDPANLLGEVDLGTDSANFVHAYCILACLRILRVNLLQLLSSLHSRQVRDMMRALPRPTLDNSLDDLSSLDDDALLAAPYPHIIETFRHDVFLGMSHPPSPPPAGHDAAIPPDDPIKRICYVLCALHQQLLELVQSPPTIADTAAICAIQQEAGMLIIGGLELFYPTQVQQCQLLSELVSSPPGLDSLMGSSCVSKLDLTLTGKAAAQDVLLKPLLERLMDDNLAQCLIPMEYEADTAAHLGTEQGSDAFCSPCPVKTLSSTLHLLIQRALQSHFVEDTPCYNARDLDGLFQQANGSSASPVSPLGPPHQLLIQAILVLQKHLMNWAGRQMSGPADGKKAERIERPTEPAGSTHGRMILEDAAQRLNQSEMSPSWACLLDYVTTAFVQSTDALLQLPGLTEERQMRAPTAPEVDRISTQDLNQVEQSFIGTVLPSLITGLLPFAYHPIFALKLMPRVSEFYRVLNRIAAALPDVVALDTAYIRQRAGDTPTESNASLPIATPPLALQRNKRTGISSFTTPGNGAAGIQEGKTVMDPLQLPRFFCVVKSLAFLAGRLAGTLTVGEGHHRKACIALRGDPFCGKWICSPLFSGGLDPTCGELLGRPVVVLTPTHRPKAPAQNSRAHHGLDAPASFHGLPSAVELSAFLDGVAMGTWHGSLAGRVRVEYLTRDAAYALLRRQADKTADVETVNALESIVWAAVVRHSGLSLELYRRTVSRSQARRLPERLVNAWAHVAELFRWYWKRRNELRSVGSSESTPQAASVAKTIIDAASVLLLVVPRNSTAYSLLHVPGSSDLPLHLLSSPDVKRPSSAARLRRAFLLVRATLRWRSYARQSTAVDHQVTAFIRGICEPIGSSTDGDAGLSNLGTNRLQHFVALLLDHHRRASVRDLGLRSFQSLLQSTKLPSLVCEVLHALGPALRDPSTTGGHFLTHLEGVGDRLHRQVQRSFESLYEDLCRRLDEMVVQIRPHRVPCPSSMTTTTQPYDVMPTPGPWDTNLSMLLLEAWGLEFRERDWSFLINSGIVGVLQRLIQSLTTALGTGNEAGAGAAGHLGDDNRGTSPLSSSSTSSQPGLPSSAQKNRSGGRTHGGMSAVMKERERRAKQCINSAWLLLRLLASRIPGIDSPDGEDSVVLSRLISWSCLLQPVFDILRDEVRESISRVRSITRAPLLTSNGTGKDGGGIDSGGGLPGDVSPAGSAGGRMQSGAGDGASGHRKRCQELIGSPRRFVNMEDGFVFPAEHLLPNPGGRGSDFSLSMWIYLTQDSTGKYRTIITRGQKTERWPVVMLRDVDRRIEVGFGLSNMATLCERLTSKDPVPLNKWSHICLVSEGSKLRLYMNGTLDYQRSNIGVPKECKHPLYVGKVPDGLVRLQGVKGGFEGSMASLRYYTRALSPIHVRIVCDQGPPELVRVKDRKCFQICSLISLIAKSPLARPHLCARPWLDLILSLILHGTSRVQQAAIRTLAKLLPHTKPCVLSSISLLDSSSPLELGSLQQAITVDPSSAVRFFLRIVGLGLHRSRLDAVTRIYASFRENKALPSLGEINIQSAISNDETFAHFLPSNVAACCITKDGPSTASGEHNGAGPIAAPTGTTGASGTRPLRINAELVQDAGALASELTMLLQHMASLPTWRDLVFKTLTAAIQGLRHRSNGPIADEQRLRYAEGVAALSVLGAHTDSIRVGVRVGIKNTDMTGVVVGYDEVGGLAHVLMEGREAEALSKKAGSTAGPGGFKILRLSAHDMYVTSDTETSARVWQLDVEAGEATRQVFMTTILHLLSQQRLASHIPGIGVSEIILAPPQALGGIHTDGACKGLPGHEETSALDDATAAQCRSLCVKAAFTMVSSPSFLHSLLTQADTAQAVLRQLMLVSIQPDTCSAFTTLPDAELRANIIRKRLYQLVVHDGDGLSSAAFASASHATQLDGLTLEQLGSGVQHVGTSLLNCPACLIRLPGGLRCNKVLGTGNSDELQTSSHPSAFDEAEEQIELSSMGQLRSRSSTAGQEEQTDNDRCGSDGEDHGASPLADMNGEGAISTELQDQLMIMGFPEEWCALALRENGNDIINASSWIVDNLDMLTRLSELQKGATEDEEEEEAEEEEEDEAEDDGQEDDEEESRARRRLNSGECSEGDQGRREGDEDEEDMDRAALEEDEEGGDESRGQRRNGPVGLMNMCLLDDELSGRDNGTLQSPGTGRRFGREEAASAGSGAGLSDKAFSGDGLAGYESDGLPKGVMPGSPSKFSLLEDRDRFAEECAADVYTEVYFPTEAPPVTVHPFSSPPYANPFSAFQPPGTSSSTNSSNRPASNGWPAVGDGGGDAGGNGTAGAGTDMTGRSILRAKAIMAEIAGMDLSQLVSASLQIETTLATIHARATVLKILVSWSEDVPLDSTLLGHSHLLLQLVKVLLFRGCQFSRLHFLPQEQIDLSCRGTIPSPGLRGASGPASVHARLLSTIGPLLMRMLRSELAIEGDVSHEAVLYPATGRTPEDPQTLGSLLTYCCIDELEAAALIGAFSDMHWGHRCLDMPDSLALLQPNVELAFWLVDHLLFLEHPQVYTIHVFTRLCNCLRSANLPLKESVLKILSRIFSKWVDILQRDRERLQREQGGDDSGTNDSDLTCSSGLPAARATLIRDAINRHLSMSRIQATVLRRISYERREDRLFFSSYVRSSLDFICIMAKLQELLADMATTTTTVVDADSGGVSCPPVDLDAIVRPSTPPLAPISSSLGEDLAASLPTLDMPQLDAPLIQQTSDTALLVQWSEASASRPSTFQSTGSSTTSNSLFELEVSDRNSRVKAHGAGQQQETAALPPSDGEDDNGGSYRPVYRGPALHFRMEGVSASRMYHFRIRSMSGGTMGRWSNAASIQTKAVLPFNFDRLNAGPTIFVSRDNMSASFANNESWSTVLGTTAFLCGRNYWEVHVDKSTTSYIFIGVARRQADLRTFLGGDDHGWGYIGDRALYSKRTKVKAYGQRFGEGDTIGVTLDLDRGTLSFSKNGIDMGVAFEGLAGELLPAVAFYNQNQRVSLVRKAFSCPGAGVTIPGSPASVGIGEVLEVSQVMGAMLTRQPLTAAVAREAHRSFLAWEAGTTFRCTTLVGYQLQVDTSDEACRPFGFRSNDRVRTPRGNAVMVGVADGKPWFQVDGEPGVWFFSLHAIREGRAASGYFSPTPALVRRPRSRLTDMSKEAASAFTRSSPLASQAAGPAQQQQPQQQASTTMSLEAFLQLGDCPRWTAAMDALLVRAVNELCGLKQLCPWNLTTRLVLATVTPIRPELDALAREAAIRRRTDQDDDQQSPLSSPVGGTVTDDAILARFAVLRLFNDRLAHVLPFVGLGDGLPSVALPTAMLSVWGLPSPERGLAVGDHPRHHTQGTRVFNDGCGRGLGPLLCTLRGSVFTVTKERVLQASITRTTTPSKKADDDYDYPDDLPQVLLNRPKAINARKDPDAEARLGMSLFGQLFEELRCLDPPLLRMGYTHPMDDGQQRTFKVKFEGEGVDDYGGPYREIFAQVSEELQMLRPGSAPLECVLPVLQPSSNARSNGAMTASSTMADSLVLQPGRTRQSDMAMYSFLGQLIGIALRSRVFVRMGFPSVVWKAMVAEPLVEADLADLDQAAYAFVGKTRQLCRVLERAKLKKQEDLPFSRAGVGPSNDEERRQMRSAELEQALEGISWTARLSDETEIELRPGGREQAVLSEDAREYLRQLVSSRLHETDEGLAALRHGLSTIVPPSVLPLLTWYEMRGLVCGRKPIDVDLLQANTEYDDDVLPEDPHIVHFWSVLREEFDEAELSHFLRFVWARPSLPASAAEFQQKFKIQSAVGEAAKGCPDTYLPKAHTCFFSLNLPRYSSKEVMAAKLRYAMYNCVEMDADFRLADNEMTGWDID